MKKVTTRRLEETSWLAQIISDRMDVEFSKNGASVKWNCLHVFKIIVNEADNKMDGIFYVNDEQTHSRQIIIQNIPSLMKYGTDFDKEHMQAKLRGLAERYTDDDGNYIVSVLTTHDLNSAVIKDISLLMDAISHS